jgi:SAM-dependent methyltransferase
MKEKIKNFPIFYEVCRFILNPGIRFFPFRRNRILRSILSQKNSRVLNVGSGHLKLPGILNIDISPYKGVSVISDAHNLPFRSEKFEALILEAILEHVSDPIKVVRESYRVLKKDGILLVELPFISEFHNSPFDYHRFTLPGAELLLKDFNKIESGISVGPTGALNGVLRNYLATMFSFNNITLYEILNMFLGLILFPLKFLDLIFNRFNSSQNIAANFYFIGRK